MRLDVYTPGTPSGAETNDVKRSGTIRPQPGAQTSDPAGGAWLKERPQVSHMGQLMRELHGIKTDDPEAFKRIAATISQKLHTLAGDQAHEGPERLSLMAERFELASLQGDLSAFRSTPQPYGQVLRGPWAYRQTNDLQEAGPDVQAVMGAVLDEYANSRQYPGATRSHFEPAARATASESGALEPGE